MKSNAVEFHTPDAILDDLVEIAMKISGTAPVLADHTYGTIGMQIAASKSALEAVK